MTRIVKGFRYAVGGIHPVTFEARDYQNGEIPADALAYGKRKGFIKDVETKEEVPEETKPDGTGTGKRGGKKGRK